MRKLLSYLLILIFLTAYGRCVADQFGMLHSSETSCCVTVCETDSHCSVNDNEHSDHPDSQTPETSEEPDQPMPCQLCFILDSDGMLIEDSVQLPSPILLELTDFFSFTATLDDILRAHVISFSQELIPPALPDPSAELRSRLLRIDAKTTPVRGPSIA